ncbi:hypothetical protein BJ170DRAFT_701298 [Xylariales sp. AK1849]|nr:hypothetical protein BJ170DRAFT_701298 [Xylariales sp. AK1849]
MDVMMKVTVEQYRTLPVLANESTCSGKTYVVTGCNTGLGLETARYLVQFLTSRVVLAVRNLTAGENAKEDIEKSTGRKGVLDVWHLDMASYTSIQNFAKKVSTELDRIDGFVANAGVMVDKWELTEGMEITVFVNVIGTLFLAALLIPKLSESGRKLGIQPTHVFVVSTLGYTAKAEIDKSCNGVIFDGLNDEKRAKMDQRYALTKLVEECAIRQLAALCPVERIGVILNMAAPGLCSTGLGQGTGTLTRLTVGTLRAMWARTPEVGTKKVHGKLLSGCQIKEYWVPDWLSNEKGQQLQKTIWTELVDRLEAVQPGVIAQIS